MCLWAKQKPHCKLANVQLPTCGPKHLKGGWTEQKSWRRRQKRRRVESRVSQILRRLGYTHTHTHTDTHRDTQRHTHACTHTQLNWLGFQLIKQSFSCFLSSRCHCLFPFLSVTQNRDLSISSPPQLPPPPLSVLPPAGAGCVLGRFLSHCHQEPRSGPEEWLENTEEQDNYPAALWLHTVRPSGAGERRRLLALLWRRHGTPDVIK